MSINNKVAVLLEEKIWHLKGCKPSDELTNQFIKVLSMLQVSRQIIIKMRYGLNEQEQKYKWREILDEINTLYPEYPCLMHRIKDFERQTWIKINQNMRLTEFNIACNDLFRCMIETS